MRGSRLAPLIKAAFQGHLVSNLTGSEHRARLARSAVGVMCVRAVGLATVFVLNVVLARILKTSGYGAYTFGLSLAGMTMVVGTMGLPRLLVREVAALSVRRRFPLIRGLLVWSEWSVIVISGVLAVSVALLPFLFPTVGLPSSKSVFIWSGVLIPLIALGALRAAELRGFGRVTSGLIPESIIRPGLLLAAVIFCETINEWILTPGRIMALHAAAALAALGAASWWLLRVAPKELRRVESAKPNATWRREAVPFFGMGIVEAANAHVGIILVGFLATASELGVYKSALALAALIPFFFAGINTVIQPEVARLHAEGDRAALQALITAAARTAFAATLPMAIALVVFGRPILRHVFGIDFTGGYTFMVILTAGYVINVASGPVGLVLNMTEHPEDSLVGLTLAATWNLLGGFLLVLKWGAQGMAFATSIGFAIWNVYLLYRVRARTGLRATVFG